MDAAIILVDGLPTCRKLREDQGRRPRRVRPRRDSGRAPIRESARDGFTFMSNEVSSERRVGASVGRIAEMMRDTKARGRRSPSSPVRSWSTPAAPCFSPISSGRLRRRAARGQRHRRPRRGAGALRHLARRGSRGGRARSGRPPPSHAGDQRHQPRGGIRAAVADGRADERRHGRVVRARRANTCSRAASATTGRSSTRLPTRRRAGPLRRGPGRRRAGADAVDDAARIGVGTCCRPGCPSCAWHQPGGRHQARRSRVSQTIGSSPTSGCSCINSHDNWNSVVGAARSLEPPYVLPVLERNCMGSMT